MERRQLKEFRKTIYFVLAKSLTSKLQLGYKYDEVKLIEFKFSQFRSSVYNGKKCLVLAVFRNTQLALFSLRFFILCAAILTCKTLETKGTKKGLTSCIFIWCNLALKCPSKTKKWPKVKNLKLKMQIRRSFPKMG